jgi:hypothetical protein
MITLALRPQQLKSYHYLKKERPCFTINMCFFRKYPTLLDYKIHSHYKKALKLKKTTVDEKNRHSYNIIGYIEMKQFKRPLTYLNTYNKKKVGII